jgi:hypothetical protein
MSFITATEGHYQNHQLRDMLLGAALGDEGSCVHTVGQCHGVCSWPVWFAVTRTSLGGAFVTSASLQSLVRSMVSIRSSPFTVDELYGFRKAQTSTFYLFVDLSKNPLTATDLMPAVARQCNLFAPTQSQVDRLHEVLDRLGTRHAGSLLRPNLADPHARLPERRVRLDPLEPR